MGETKKYVEQIVSLEESLKKKKAQNAKEIEAMEKASAEKVAKIQEDVNSFQEEMTKQSEAALVAAEAALLQEKGEEEKKRDLLEALFEKKALKIRDKMYSMLFDEEKADE